MERWFILILISLSLFGQAHGRFLKSRHLLQVPIGFPPLFHGFPPLPPMPPWGFGPFPHAPSRGSTVSIPISGWRWRCRRISTVPKRKHQRRCWRIYAIPKRRWHMRTSTIPMSRLWRKSIIPVLIPNMKRSVGGLWLVASTPIVDEPKVIHVW